jgi:uncharacterized membrane protein
MESLNLAHAHLLLNHLPFIGFAIALCIYIGALFAKSESLKRVGLVLFFLVALLAIPAYMTGSAAERVVCPELKCPDTISPTYIRIHEDWALLAFVVMEMTGFFAWLALWQLQKRARVASWNWAVVLVLGVIACGLMARAADMGGEIRHPEMRYASEAVMPAWESCAATEGVARCIGAVVAGNTGVGWLWPAAETIHFIGLCLLFVVVLILDLRILGMAKGLPFKALYQLLPLGMLGFLLNFITGMLFFLAAPGQYVNNIEFHRKVLLIMLAGINVLYFMLFDEDWAMGPSDNAPVRTKVAAVSAIVLWVGILYYGHMLPFLGNAF